MEKILRRVKCSERLPERDKWYFVNHVTRAPITGVGDYLKWISETKQWFGIRIQDVFEVGEIEYWYEEIEVESESLADKFRTSKLFAKERYEKAFKFLAKMLLRREFDSIEQEITKALKIAAGLEEI